MCFSIVIAFFQHEENPDYCINSCKDILITSVLRRLERDMVVAKRIWQINLDFSNRNSRLNCQKAISPKIVYRKGEVLRLHFVRMKNFSMKNIPKSNYIGIVRWSIKLLSSLSLIPFQWNDESHGTFGKMLPKPKGKRTLWWVWCFTLWLRTIALALKIGYQVESNKLSLGIGVLFLLWLSVFIAGSLLTIHPSVKLEEFCFTFNAFVEFERNHGVVPLTGATNVVAVLLFTQTLCIPFVLPLFSWIAPCAPQFIGSDFLKDENGTCMANFLHILIIYSIEVICTIPIGGIAAFFSVYAIYLTKSLIRYLLFVKRTSPVELFKNLHSHTSMVNCSTLYRQTQILLHFYHDCFQMQLLPNMLISSSFIIICCLFATVELKSELPFIVYIVFPFILIITSMFLLIMLEMASCVVPLSKSIKLQWANRFHGKSAWFKRFSRSCPLLKIVAGPFSKIGRDRVAIIIRFCLQRAIFFIVWSRKARGLQINTK